MLNELTTKADSFYRDLEEEGVIHNQEDLKNFLNNLVDYLESIGGKVEGMKYTDNR
jgi:hypothetical protein